MTEVYLTRGQHGERDELSKRRQFTVQGILQSGAVIKVLTGLYILLINPRIQIVGQMHIRKINRIVLPALAQ